MYSGHEFWIVAEYYTGELAHEIHYCLTLFRNVCYLPFVRKLVGSIGSIVQDLKTRSLPEYGVARRLPILGQAPGLQIGSKYVILLLV